MNKCQWHDHDHRISQGKRIFKENRWTGSLDACTWALRRRVKGRRRPDWSCRETWDGGLNVVEVSKTNFVFSLAHHFWFRLLLDTVLRWIFSWLQWLCQVCMFSSCRRVLRNRHFLCQNGGTEARSAPRPDILCVEAADPNRLHFGKWRIMINYD